MGYSRFASSHLCHSRLNHCINLRGHCVVPAWRNSYLIVYTEVRKKTDFDADKQNLCYRNFCLIIFQDVRPALSSSLACKSTFSPLTVTVVAIQPIMPKYRTRMLASMRGENAFPKNDKKLGTGRTLISPCK